MGLFGNLFKSEFEKWVERASHEELSDAYEEERQDWIKNGFNGGTGEKTSKMNFLNEEINKRVAEEWGNDPQWERMVPSIITISVRYSYSFCSAIYPVCWDSDPLQRIMV